MKHVGKRAALLLAGILAALLVYGTAIEPRLILDTERHEASIPNLGAGWEGREIAVLADFQVGMWLGNTAMAKRAVKRAVDGKPAVVLLAGDFLYGTGPDATPEINTVLDVLRPLTQADLPTFAVMGNHDYAVGAAEKLTAALEAHGIDVLLNESAGVPAQRPGDHPLHVVGIGPARPGLDDAAKALRELPANAPRVVLMHNPTSFLQLPAATAPLAVAGHTHCGQIALPGLPSWSYLDLTSEEEVVAEGFADDDYGAPGNRLFVTCGIGFSLIPVRINAPPEVAFFKLTAARPAADERN